MATLVVSVNADARGLSNKCTFYGVLNQWNLRHVVTEKKRTISYHSLDSGGSGEDFAYPYALIECLFRSPSQLDVRTVGSQQELTAH